VGAWRVSRVVALAAAAALALARMALAAEPVAVLELFTSEGCSSCPPAERLLPQLAASVKGGRAIALEWHVDYWDHLGWKDPFDSREATERQQAYARALKLEQLYTPQLVVNGERECVGSSRVAAAAAIRAALSKSVATALTLHATRERGEIRVSYALDAPRPGATLGIALASRVETVRVGAGENAGRTLEHTNVVLAWRELRLGPARAGEVRIPLPRGRDGANLRVAGLVQDPSTRAILGAVIE
jgi:hypothetical protein